MRYLIVIYILLHFCVISFSVDSTKVKKGWTFGLLPAITYNSDLGLQYGGIVNFYNFGNGERYPKYNHSIYFEMSRFTKGSGINRIFYDSDQLIKGVRFTGNLLLLTEKALDFYGFNGAKAVYRPEWEEKGGAYKSRVFYRHDRQMLALKMDFTINTKLSFLKAYLGMSLYGVETGSVNIDRLNKGKKEGDKLPDIKGLYDLYTEWGLIGEDEKGGGNHAVFKVGLVADTRDNMANPMRGIWSELLWVHSPKYVLNKKYAFSLLSCTHRQYFTLVDRDLSFAYRLGYQLPIYGRVPFYLLPIIYTSYSNSSSYEGMGGSKSVRGILRNRVVGKSLLYWNFELRWKFYHGQLFKQNLYVALNTFLDGGKLMEEVRLDKLEVLRAELGKSYEDYFSDRSDPAHLALGGGIRFVLNANFIVACDYGVPTRKEDGKSRMYINLNYLF